ncbi:MAG: hypothetical protein JW915_09040 [Chitinispirillaceae bacterium]|nr:hypothetical protein [Chitinispirillaceae bacterium]
MKYSSYKGILIICVTIIAFSMEAISDTTSTPESKPSINPKTLLLSSAIIPGAGQLLSRKYLKAGTFLALEAIAVSAAIGWDQIAQSRVGEYHKVLVSSALDTGISKARILEDAHVKKFQTMDAELKRYNYLTLAGGIYLYNLLDAFELTGLLKDNKQRNPTMALGLALIPGLGLGQIYNGSYSKAGLFMMGQVQLGVIAYNKDRMMRLAESNYRRVSDTTITPSSIKALSSSDWDSRRRAELKQRNSFIWYSIFVYVIGILDAVVDAHLHDYQEQMKIEPDLVPSENGAGLNLRLNF